MPHAVHVLLRAWNRAPIQPSVKSTSRATGSNPPIDVAPPLATTLVAPDRRLARIVAYEVATPVGATPSGSAGIPFHSVQPFNDALDRPFIRPSVRPSTSLSIYIPRHPSHSQRQMRTLVVSKSTTLTSRRCSSLFSISRLFVFSKLSTFVSSFHFSIMLLVSLFTKSYIHKHIYTHKAGLFLFILKYSQRGARIIEKGFWGFLFSSFIRSLAWLRRSVTCALIAIKTNLLIILRYI